MILTSEITGKTYKGDNLRHIVGLMEKDDREFKEAKEKEELAKKEAEEKKNKALAEAKEAYDKACKAYDEALKLFNIARDERGKAYEKYASLDNNIARGTAYEYFVDWLTSIC